MNDASDRPGAAESKGLGWRSPWLILAVLALALAGWQWMETRQRLAETQQELARRLSESDSVARESRAQARQAQEQSASLLARIGELEGKLAESKGQQAMLESLYQNLARSRDEWALAEIEQGVTLAAQQLQLAGNVQSAILALQAADARVSGNNRPQFIALRKAFSRDLDRLRALPTIDMPAMSLRLEGLVMAIDTLPLAVDVRPHENPAQTGGNDAPQVSVVSLAFWQQLASLFWHEVRSLIRIQRFDREEPALLAPGQAFFLRENLKLRLLNARLALHGRDQWTFRHEIAQIRSWVTRYFDAREKSVQIVTQTLQQLAAAEVAINLPQLTESLSAIKTFRLGKEAR